MNIVYQVKKTTNFYDEVTFSANKLIKNIMGSSAASRNFKISPGYIGNIACGRYTPIEENIGLSIDILKKLDYKLRDKYDYVAAVVPINFGKTPKNHELQICELSRTVVDLDKTNNKTKAIMFYAYCYEPKRGVGIKAMDYWREELFDGEGTVELSKSTGLSRITVRHAVNRKISPRISTVQKFLKPYRKKLVILKIHSEKSIHSVVDGNEIILMR